MSAADAHRPALAQRDFRLYWLGQLVSLIGAWMQQVAQGWVVVGLTGSTTAIAGVAMANALPQVVLLFSGGIAADRGDRRRILIWTQLAMALLAFVYAGLVATGQLSLPLVYLLAAALGVVLAFDLPAQQALVPQLVTPEAIPQAVALNQAIFHGSRIIGPALAGLLIAATSPAMAFVANGVSYFAVVASLLVIRPRPREGGPPSASGLAALREGLAFVAAPGRVRTLIGYTGITTAFVFPFLVVFLPIVVKRVYTGGERELGLIMTVSGAAALAGSLTLLRLARRAGPDLLLGASCGVALGLVGLSLPRHTWPALPAMLVTSFSVSLALGLTTTLIQLAVPDRLRGRVMSVNTLNFMALMPASALVLGALGERLDLALLLRLAGIGYGLSAAAWLLAGRERRRPGPAAPGG